MTVPSQEYRRSWLVSPERLSTGLDRQVQGWIHWARQSGFSLGRLKRQAEAIREQADELAGLSDRKLKSLLAGIKARARRFPGEANERALPLLVVAAGRTLGMTPYLEQVMGALAMYQGGIAEMATGEGKTLTAGLPAVLAAWSGLPCHVLTVNDYLAERDAELMEPLYSFCGVSMGVVLREMTPEERRAQYGNGIVYTTCQELLGDFLKDRLKVDRLGHPARQMLRSLVRKEGPPENRLVLSGLDTVIVDEADSILIDEAVTPLIISAKRENRVLSEAVLAASFIAEEMAIKRDYLVDYKLRSIEVTDQGREKLAQYSGRLKGVWASPNRSLELLRQALSARAFFIQGKDYVIKDGALVIVDERTGRLMPDRTWSSGLHQAVEAKEGLEITHPTETLTSLSFQRFFRLFRKLSGMTGTGREVAGEIWHVYKARLVRIPTHKPSRRLTMRESVFPDLASKYEAVVEEVKAVSALGRPVLVGARTVKDSERLAELLAARGVDFDLLNAVRHKHEAAIVARAGRKGWVTIATNMAGRGTDIKLGEGVYELGGLHVISLERNESRRIDRQLFGRCARQGDPGSVHGFVSVEDEALVRFIPAVVLNMLKALQKRRMPGSEAVVKAALWLAEKRLTMQSSRARMDVLRHDDFLEEALSFSGSKM